MPITVNVQIRDSAKRNGVKLWMVAETLGMSDSVFSRKLRHELPDEDRENILGIIAQLGAENGRAS